MNALFMTVRLGCKLSLLMIFSTVTRPSGLMIYTIIIIVVSFAANQVTHNGTPFDCYVYFSFVAGMMLYPCGILRKNFTKAERNFLLFKTLIELGVFAAIIYPEHGFPFKGEKLMVLGYIWVGLFMAWAVLYIYSIFMKIKAGNRSCHDWLQSIFTQ